MVCIVLGVGGIKSLSLPIRDVNFTVEKVNYFFRGSPVWGFKYWDILGKLTYIQ